MARSTNPTMQRRHFELIAETIKDTLMNPKEKSYIAKAFAARLASTNGQFRREQFLEACGVTESNDE